MSNGAASLGCVTFVQFAAIVSLSLGLTNLLPAPLLTMAICCFMRSRQHSVALSAADQEFGVRPAGCCCSGLFAGANDLRQIFEL